MTAAGPSVAAATRPAAWLKDNLAFILLLSTLVLFSSKSLYNIPVGMMALLGLWRCVRSPRNVFAGPAVRLYTMLFMALWLPQLLSMTDAVNFNHSSSTVFPYLRFLFMGLYILTEPRLETLLCRIRHASFWVAVFWGIDAMIQYITGANLFGYPYEAGHITGMFYPDNTITHLLAAFSPLYFDTIRRYSRKHLTAWLLILPLFSVVILGERRVAWIMLAISVCGYLYYLLRYTDLWKTSRHHILAAAFSCLALLVFLIWNNQTLQDRIVTTAGLFSLDYELMDQATARRLPIWETSVEIIRHHWINGIGPRGFRHVYAQYSTPDNYFHETGTTHPHQLLLEVIAETGLIGLAGLLVFIYAFCRKLLTRDRLPHIFPAVLSVLIIMFPFSSNLAFYGSYWSSVIWWFLLYTLLAARPPAT